MSSQTVWPRAIIVFALSFWLVGLEAQESSTAQELIRQEEVRQTFEDALETMYEGASDGTVLPDIVAAAEHVVPLGGDAIPILANEIEQQNRRTFFFAAYTLGRIGTPEAAKVLREAVRTAEKQRRAEWPTLRKAWACWGLALMGETDAAAMINHGRHLAGITPMARQFSAIEEIAVMTVPESAAALHRQLETIDDEDDPRMSVRVTILAAIRRVADPSSVPALLALLEDGHPILQGEAARALGAIDSPEASAALLERLNTPDGRIRRGVALGLQLNPPGEGLEKVVARLDLEEDPVIRGILYDVVARGGGVAYTDDLLAYWGRPAPADRLSLTALLPELDREKAWPYLTQAIEDPNASVVFAAARSAARIGDDRAIELLIDSVASPFWLRAQAAVEQLQSLGATRAADGIATRLIDVELAPASSNPERRTHATALARALTALGYSKRIDDLREATARQNDVKLVRELEQLIADVELTAANGNKRKRWLETLASPDEHQRRLAYAWFARRGDRQSAPSLVQTFGRVEPSEGIEILRALGALDTPESKQLIERILSEPDFDESRFTALRDMAAWSARRLGMRDVLASAVDRRDGRDYLPLVYAAVLDGDDGIEVLQRYRLPRLRYPATSRGLEFEKIDWMRRELAHGRSIAEMDAPPAQVRI